MFNYLINVIIWILLAIYEWKLFQSKSYFFVCIWQELVFSLGWVDLMLLL